MNLIGLLTLSPAYACGGFFCNSLEPVVQKAERIVFVVDEVAETVETHVQVEYEGPAAEFAWIVPVQSVPELFVTSELLFSTVGVQLRPSFQMSWAEEGECVWDGRGGFWSSSNRNTLNTAVPNIAEGDFDGGAQGPPPVVVINEATVGPYETVTLQATEINALMDWLAANEYAIPSTAADAIAPYISGSGYFVALKLVKGNETGDLAPLGLRYSGTTPAVPIQLTAVAAADDLRLEVTVFGNRRAVPASYLHVTINDAAINWFDFGANYDEVITKAADEAGGHAFATDYAGSTDVLFANFAIDAELNSLSAAITPTDWIVEVQRQGFQGTSDMLSLFERWFPVRAGLNEIDVYNCPECHANWFVGNNFDANAVTSDLNERILVPRKAIDALINEYPYVTRLTSSLSASEMTIDPTFVFNEHMGDVDLFRTSELIHECRGGKKISKAKRRLVLPDGREIKLPSQQWFNEHNVTEEEYLEELGETNAALIQRTGTDAPVTVADFTEDLARQVNLFNGTGPGCGCQSTQAVLPTLTGMLGLLGVLGLRRR